SHTFVASAEIDHRAPCPALNALANHGYIPHSGTNVGFVQLVKALTKVYNISLPLALLLAVPAFLIYGTLENKSNPFKWEFTLDLASLSAFGHTKIAHYASLVHPNHPSHAPGPDLVKDVLERAQHRYRPDGLNIGDLAALRVTREAALLPPMKMDPLHIQIALGESSLAWLVMREHVQNGDEDVIPAKRVEQWFGEERLPDGWWEQVRPKKTIGLLDARKKAGEVQK
ncbi:Chloroperoxidase, partial [Mycena floridula]